MKKILFASTALVASAGIAAAEIEFSGEAGFGFIYDDASGEWMPDYYTTLSVSMTGETDGGLAFGADFDITAGETSIGDSAVYIEGGFGKLSVGDVGSAVDETLGLGDLGYDGLGTDNIAEILVDAYDSGNLMYQGTFGDFGVALSYDFQGAENLSIAATYDTGDYNFGLGYDTIDILGTTVSAFHVAAGASIADFSIDALYSNSDDLDLEAFGVTVGYTMGAVEVTAAYSEASTTGASVDGYGIGVAYDLGGGATLAAGVGEVAGVTVADLGINMEF